MKYDENYFNLNKTFGLLTVLSLDKPMKDKRGYYRRYCNCICSCGKHIKVEKGNLVRQQTKSCGCNRYPTGSKSNCWKGKGIIPGTVWSNICRGARERNIPIDITFSYIEKLFEKQNRKCALTGQLLSFTNSNASLDRINSTKGYIKGNVQWVHKDINLMKLDHSEDKFIELCKLVVEHSL